MNSKYSFMLASVFMAVLLWFYVSVMQYNNNVANDTVRNMELWVEIEVIGIKSAMVIEDIPEYINVKFQARNERLSKLSADDFKAVVDVSEAKMGINILPVDVTVPEGVNLLDVVPEHITVVVDELIEKDLKVDLFLRGAPSVGYVVGEPKVVPDTVLARGPSKALDKIDTVPVMLDIKNAKDDINIELPVSIANGKIELIPDAVRVVLPIEIGLPYKTFAVVPNVTGDFLSYDLEITVDPPVVNVYAPENVLNTLEKVYTEEIELESFGVKNEEIIQTVELVMPLGTLLLEPQEVNVSIGINDFKNKEEKEEAF